MIESEVRPIIYNQFIYSWEDPNLHSDKVPYTFDNEDFDSDGLSEWVRLSVRMGPGGQQTLGTPGNRVYQRRGLIIVQLFVAVDGGLLRLDELGIMVRDIFEGKTIDQVRLYDSNYRSVNPEDNWLRGNVTTSFAFDEIK